MGDRLYKFVKGLFFQVPLTILWLLGFVTIIIPFIYWIITGDSYFEAAEDRIWNDWYD